MKVGSLDESSIAAFTALTFAAGAAGSFLLRRLAQRLLLVRRTKGSDALPTMSRVRGVSMELKALDEKCAKLQRLIADADERIAAIQDLHRQTPSPDRHSSGGARPAPTRSSRGNRQPFRPLVVRLDEGSQSDDVAPEAGLQESISRFAAWRRGDS